MRSITHLINYYFTQTNIGIGEIEATDWNALLEYSHRNGIDGVVWGVMDRLQTEGKINLSLKEKVDWYGNVREIYTYNERAKTVLYKLRDVLERKQIKCVVLKGVSCAQYYEKPEYRPAGDIDLYVGKDNYERSIMAFRESGLNLEWGHEDVRHIVFIIEGLVVELHREWELRSDYCEDNLITVEGMNGIYCLKREWNIVYVFAHLYRHFIGRGITLRQLMDWVVMGGNSIRSKAVLDLELVGKLIHAEGLESPWNSFGWMVKRYLGVEMVCMAGTESPRVSDGIWHLSFDLQKYTPSGRVVVESNLGRLLSVYRGYFRTWKLFPKDCIKYWLRLVVNNVKGAMRR